MIVTSRRCFINVLAQFMDVDTLINATYYIADVKRRDNMVQFEQKLSYNEYGQLVQETVCNGAMNAITRYNIKYGHGELDPSTFQTTLFVGNPEATLSSSETAIEAFLRYLNQSDTMMNVYNFLWDRPIKGNGLRIMVFYEDDSVNEFVHYICEYLAKNFGEDITFIDAKYRRGYVKGKEFYQGDKAYAAKTMHDIQDYILLTNFNMAISQLGYDETISNLTTWLNSFPPPQLMHLYELIFPNDPLPSGNYTTDHIKQIIIGRVSEGLPKNPFPMNNLYMSNEYLEQLRQQLQVEDD